MRKTMKFTQGRKQYVKREVTPEEAQINNRLLIIMIFKCEADWAYAMQMRQLMANKGQVKIGDTIAQQMAARNENRVKYHVQKKLQRSFKTAQKLLEVS
jgi:hypothetical protein